jgi:hypothetical protein
VAPVSKTLGLSAFDSVVIALSGMIYSRAIGDRECNVTNRIVHSILPGKVPNYLEISGGWDRTTIPAAFPGHLPCPAIEE